MDHLPSPPTGDGLHALVLRLRAAKARLRYHSRPGHGASKTRRPSGEAKALARDDVDSLTREIENFKRATKISRADKRRLYQNVRNEKSV